MKQNFSNYFQNNISEIQKNEKNNLKHEEIILYNKKNEPVKFKDIVLQNEYGFAQICMKRITNVKF